jgi:hypothetical protein
MGRVDEAVVEERAAVDAFAAQGDSRLTAASRIYLSHFLEQAGDLAAARAEAEAAVTGTAIPGVRAYALGTLARALLSAGDVAAARAPAAEAMAIMASLGGLEEGEPLVRLAHAEVLLAGGDVDAARAALAEARDHVLSRAAKVKDPARRQSFLAAVPEHARTLALAERLGA